MRTGGGLEIPCNPARRKPDSKDRSRYEMNDNLDLMIRFNHPSRISGYPPRSSSIRIPPPTLLALVSCSLVRPLVLPRMFTGRRKRSGSGMNRRSTSISLLFQKTARRESCAECALFRMDVSCPRNCGTTIATRPAITRASSTSPLASVHRRDSSAIPMIRTSC